MLAVEIPDGLFFAIVPAVLVLLVGLMAWVVREQGKSAVDRAVLNSKFDNLEERVQDLEDEQKDVRRR